MQLFSGVNMHHTYIHAQVAVYWRVKMTDTHTQTTLDLACTNTHISRNTSFLCTYRSASIHTTTSSSLLEIWRMMTDTHAHTQTYTHSWLFAKTHIHLVVRSSFTLTGAFSLHTCSFTPNSIFTSPVWAECSYSIDGRIALCTVRHRGLERSFSSFISRCDYLSLVVV